MKAPANRRFVGGDLPALGGPATLAKDLDPYAHEAVKTLRHDPWSYSWQEIADQFGITRQAACLRFRKAGGDRRPGPTRVRSL